MLRAQRAARPTAVRIDGIVKSFGGACAADGISFEIERGTIHALLGGNGSGKSTTIKILAGVYQADAGAIEVAGVRHDARTFSPRQAWDAGLRFVHQQQTTFADLTIAENLAIGHRFETSAGGRVRWRAQHRRAQQVLDQFGIDADPRDELAHCGIATQTMVAIARALQGVEQGDERVLVLDEPTAPLPPGEVRLLLAALRRFSRDGQTILYVTHRLGEVVEIADQATVLRDGSVVGRLDEGEIDHDRLVELIMGKRVQAVLSQHTRARRGDVLLECDDVVGGPVRGASLSVSAGEVVAVAGLLGSGRSSLLRLVAGDLRREAGAIRLAGQPVDFSGPRHATDAGVAYSPEDRLASAAFLDLSVRDNIGIASVGDYFRRGILNHRAERRDARRLLSEFWVKAASTEVPLSTMSGGNQQKALLVRWLRLHPRLLLLDEPTQGVDVGARAEIWQLVRNAVDAGAAALVVLSDFEELVEVCDRVVVLSAGRTVAELDCDGLSDGVLEHAVLSAERAAA
ncbi:ABC transporter related protein [Conexibacter woesei DSM 14684]|uniref:ABC transporter related protein n=1 Tax=Conexibacter woesei (strain DSM 14684 / CCUG 47730 / CIP 108061 / JCM 11494 / NBRC 100937 / ID131577) TaxID=469383 RepID=D3F4H7_CONWI|nr:ABC transporter related protein [Conexibacter woesei DSM 14684]